jgi:hypothetical protein
MAKNLGLEEALNRLPVKKRNRGYKPAETIFSLMGMLQSGGMALDDMGLLAGDEGMRTMLGALPAANTMGEFLRRFGNSALHRLGRIQLETAVQVIEASGLSSITVDIDAFFLESQKSDVKMNYEGEWGYNPVAVTCAELKMPLAGLFRAGNASPMAHLGGLLERVLGRLEGKKIRVRSDSAGYQAGVVRVIQNAGADFTITVRKDKAVLETIRSIPSYAWKICENEAWGNRVTEMAETVHAFGDEDLPAQRVVVTRWRKEQMELFDQEPFEYHAVMTSLNDLPGEEVLKFHRLRQDGSENVNKELHGGFGLSKLPCREMKANAAYFQIALLSCTVFVAMKRLTLPESWWHHTIKTVRHRLIRLAGVVMWRSRYLWLKISERYPHWKVFEEARWRVIGLSTELSSG